MPKTTEVSSLSPPVNIVLAHSGKKLRKLQKKIGVTCFPGEDDSDARTVWRDPEANLFIVYMNPSCLERPDEEDIALLAHEAVHVSQGYFRSIGENEPADEQQAYFVQAVMEELASQHFAWKKRHTL